MKKIKSIKEHDACHSMVTYEDGTVECLANSEIPKKTKKPSKKKDK